MAKPQCLSEGYQLTVQYTEDPQQIWVALRFIGEPTDRVKKLAEEHLNRINCSRPVELFGECRGSMPEHIATILADALANSDRRETPVRDKTAEAQA